MHDLDNEVCEVSLRHACFGKLYCGVNKYLAVTFMVTLSRNLRR